MVRMSHGATQAAGGRSAGTETGNAPVIVLSYMHAGAAKAQSALAAGSGLVCTSGTGILPLCAAAADTWRRIEGQPGMALTGLAAASVRSLVNAQVMAIVAGSSQTRWCELATTTPETAETFLQLFPNARFVCVHRRCPEVIQAAVQANPWGLQGQGFTPYLLSYFGNSVAALASYWANSVEQLIAFERAHQQSTHRLRYEDLADDQALATVRDALGLGATTRNDGHPGWLAEPGAPAAPPEAAVPTQMIPDPLRQRITRLQTELGYTPPDI
jgi:sulfotransferase family protein